MQIVLNLANHLDTTRTKKSLNIDKQVNTDTFEYQNCQQVWPNRVSHVSTITYIRLYVAVKSQRFSQCRAYCRMLSIVSRCYLRLHEVHYVFKKRQSPRVCQFETCICIQMPGWEARAAPSRWGRRGPFCRCKAPIFLCFSASWARVPHPSLTRPLRRPLGYQIVAVRWKTLELSRNNRNIIIQQRVRWRLFVLS